MSPTKFSTFTEMKIDDIAGETGCNTVLEVLCFGSITIFYHRTMHRPIAAYYYYYSLRDGCMPMCIVTSAQETRCELLTQAISNLKTPSKIIERRVALHLNSYLMNSNLHENFPSSFY